ncbi:hypothetical protein PYCCODRAFT_975648 [Trametes coccinea BRFM310]|uniref:Uncharacterized protein n=1 Tax=Trametes coccinea (strain BRFM310) TaxID=1353009 RepID=A0A1Y2IBW7_TRAC3|nr:hypothetical protein PYCCODRAFT_975648 [Trametes coccinea BRFM310]
MGSGPEPNAIGQRAADEGRAMYIQYAARQPPHYCPFARSGALVLGELFPAAAARQCTPPNSYSHVVSVERRTPYAHCTRVVSPGNGAPTPSPCYHPLMTGARQGSHTDVPGRLRCAVHLSSRAICGVVTSRRFREHREVRRRRRTCERCRPIAASQAVHRAGQSLLVSAQRSARGVCSAPLLIDSWTVRECLCHGGLTCIWASFQSTRKLHVELG